MITVSEDYNPYSDVRAIDCKAVFEVVDSAFAGYASVDQDFAYIAAPIGDLDNVFTGNETQYANCEMYGTALDGKSRVFPDDLTAATTGWWSNTLLRNDQDIADIYLRVNLSQAIETSGLTITFAENGIASRFTVNFYQGSQRIYSIYEPLNESAVYVIENELEYDKVLITFQRTLFNNSRVKVDKIAFGTTLIYNADNMVNANWKSSASNTADALPSNSFEITVENISKKLNVNGSGPVARYIETKQPVETFIIINGEKIFMGSYKLNQYTMDETGKTATLSFSDDFYWLSDQNYNSGSTGTATLSTVVSAILNNLEISTSYETTALANTVVKTSIPKNTTKREALRMVAQAAKCTCFFNRNGVLVFKNLATDTQSYTNPVTSDDVLDWSGIGLSDYVTKINLTVNDEYADTETEYVYGSGRYYREYKNPAASDGDGVAEWLLTQLKKRRNFELNFLGNPALEIGDHVTILDLIINDFEYFTTLTGFEYNFSIDGLRSTINLIAEVREIG